MNNQKKVIENQKYEDYWKLTLEYTDIYGTPFNRVLKEIVDFIDSDPEISSSGMTSTQYQMLQKRVNNIYPKSDFASVRKSINQYLKLGFINNRLQGYHPDTKKFLAESDKKRKNALYSKILYENSSFNRSYKTIANRSELKFLIKTIDACGTISKDELLAIMFIPIEKYEKEYLTKEELKQLVADNLEQIKADDTENRKYNQRNYLFNICQDLTDIYSQNGILSLKPLDEEAKERKTRDPYLQRIYKIQLSDETKEIYHTSKGICVLEKIAYPILIASHIKPYRVCDKAEEFDMNNGLLLSKNFDSLFDLGYITFDDHGNILASKELDITVKNAISKYHLDDVIFNSERKKYMEYHRNNVFKG